MSPSGMLFVLHLKFQCNWASCICSGSPVPGGEAISWPLSSPACQAEGAGQGPGVCPGLDAPGPSPRLKGTGGPEGKTAREVGGPKGHPTVVSILDGTGPIRALRGGSGETG